MDKVKKIFNFVNNKPFTDVENVIANTFIKFPRLPKEISDVIVSFAPYLVLLGGVIGILSILTLFSIGNVFFNSVFATGFGFLPFFYITVIASVITGIMMVISFEDLKAKIIFGWRLVFWSFTISVITMVITLNFFGALISAVISWYILVQVKELYH